MSETPSAETMTTLTSAYILRDAEGAVWVAEVPTGQEPGGVMPHLAPDDIVPVVDRTSDQVVTVRIKHHDGTTEMDLDLKTLRVSGTVGTELELMLGK